MAGLSQDYIRAPHGGYIQTMQTPLQETRSIDAPPKTIKNEGTNSTMSCRTAIPRENSFVFDLTVQVSNLPSGADYKQLRQHARSFETVPAWTVIHSGPVPTTGAIGFKTACDAQNAVDILHGSLFQGMLLDVRLWDQGNYAPVVAKPCKCGFDCRGRNTYCVFGHPCRGSSPSDSKRRRSLRIDGAVDNDDLVHEDIETVLSVENHLGISSQISASDAPHAHENI